jgi:hypothetical protein
MLLSQEERPTPGANVKEMGGYDLYAIPANIAAAT